MPSADFISKSDFVDLFDKYSDAVANMQFWAAQLNTIASMLKVDPSYALGLDPNEKTSLDQNISLVSSVLASLQVK